MINLMRGWYSRHFSTPGTVEFALVLIVAFLIVYYLMWLVGPLVVALCLSYCLDWGVRFLMRKTRFSRQVCATTAMLIFVGMSVGILLFIVPKIVQQGGDLYHTIQQISANSAHSEAWDFDSMVAGKIHEFLGSLPDPIPSMVTYESVREHVVLGRTEVLGSVSGILTNQIMPSVVNTLSWLMYLVIVPIFMLLMLVNKDDLLRRCRTYLLPSNHAVIDEFWPKINAQIEGYIRGKIFHVIIIAIANTLAFWALGLNYAFILGLGVGLSVVIPYVGAVIISIPVILVAVFQFGFGGYLALVLVVYLIIQLLDGNVLTPILFSKAMNLDAFSILVAIFIFGGLWGFWGVFFSIPLATFIRTLVVYWPSVTPKVSYIPKR